MTSETQVVSFRKELVSVDYSTQSSDVLVKVTAFGLTKGRSFSYVGSSLHLVLTISPDSDCNLPDLHCVVISL